MDYDFFQKFIAKYNLEEWDVKQLNEVMRAFFSKQKNKQFKPKKKLYSIRLDEQDMDKLRQIAEKEWLPYQTLISSIIHKYVSN